MAAQDLAWFENRPLFGRGVVVTRARQQASQLVERLAALGAATVEVPAITVSDPADGEVRALWVTRASLIAWWLRGRGDA